LCLSLGARGIQHEKEGKSDLDACEAHE